MAKKERKKDGGGDGYFAIYITTYLWIGWLTVDRGQTKVERDQRF